MRPGAWEEGFCGPLAALTVSWGIVFWLSGLLYHIPWNSCRSNYKERCSNIWELQICKITCHLLNHSLLLLFFFFIYNPVMALDSENQQESFAFLQQPLFCEVTLSFRDSNFLTWLLFLSLTHSQLRCLKWLFLTVCITFMAIACVWKKKKAFKTWFRCTAILWEMRALVTRPEDAGALGTTLAVAEFGKKMGS